MNSLPRFLGTALFVVLAALVALAAVPLWRSQPIAAGLSAPAPTAAAAAPARPTTAATRGPARAWQNSIFALAVVSIVLAAALLIAVSLRGRSDSPVAVARQEMGTLTRLAATSAAQGAELSRERDVRRRAEEDAQLKQQLLAESVDEKIRLGRDLHDGIIQSLYAVGLTLETMRPLLAKDPSAAEQRLDDVRASLNAAIRDVRSYITGLAPENLKRASFSRTVSGLFEQLRAGRDAQFEIKVDDDAAALLSNEQNIEALQIAREAISNALRHGGATQITLRMHKGEREVCLLVQDNGRGFDPVRHRGSGHGLSNMEARAEHLGATLRVSSQPGQGARVVANFPVPNSAAS